MLLPIVLCSLTIQSLGIAQAKEPDYDRTRNVIYGRSSGMALTLDVISPKSKKNGLGAIWVVSGGWYSSHEAITPEHIDAFCGEQLSGGYTIFAVVHGSMPKCTIPEAIADLNRSVRFIRHNAKDYGIDPDRIGIFGGSAGGHLSLMQGLSPAPANDKAPDPVDRVSSNVQAVAAFFPPTDFLNYGAEGKSAIGAGGILQAFQAAFDFRVFDTKVMKFVTITDPDKISAIGKQISPLYHVDSGDPPVLILHGDADELVPYEQATRIIEKLEKANVEARLVTRPGAGHAWGPFKDDMPIIADFFDANLGKKTPAATQTAAK